MNRSPRPTRLIALLLGVLMAASACSSGSDAADAASDAGSSDSEASDVAESGSDDGVSSDEDCATAEEANSVIRRDTGWLRGITDEAAAAEATELGRDYQPLVDAVAALRPFQDLDAEGFGTMREALDSIDADIVAVQEGRYGDNVGMPVVVVIGVVIGEEICG